MKRRASPPWATCLLLALFLVNCSPASTPVQPASNDSHLLAIPAEGSLQNPA